MKRKEILKLFAWEFLNPIFLRFRKKMYRFSPKYIGLNIGCGIDNPEYWLGIDGGFTHYLIRKIPKVIGRLIFRLFNMSNHYSFDEYYSKIKSFDMIHYNIKYSLPFKNNEIPNIFSSHFFEHLSKDKAEKLLKDCYLKLKKGGRIRICVPSLESEVNNIKDAILKYETGNVNEIQKYLTLQKYGYFSYYSQHKYIYNFQSLSEILRKCGFKNITEFKFKIGNIPDVKSLDTRKGLIVEAEKI